MYCFKKNNKPIFTEKLSMAAKHFKDILAVIPTDCAVILS